MPAVETAGLSELSEAAFDVARRHKSFAAYGSEAAAVRALRLRCSGSSLEHCRVALLGAVLLLEAAAETASRHRDLLSGAWQTPGADEVASLVCSELRLACPSFSHAACRSALSWVFYWHYL